MSGGAIDPLRPLLPERTTKILSPQQYVRAIKKLGLSQQRAARFLGISDKQSARIARGEREATVAISRLLKLMIDRGIMPGDIDDEFATEGD